MGLFDVFKGSTPELTPRLALATALLFMISSDGELGQEELGQLLATIGGDQRLLDNALKYGRATKFDDFLGQSAVLLTEPQKICVLLNLCDSLLSDGRAAQQEQQMFSRFLTAYGVSDETFAPLAEAIMKKNDKSVLS